MPVSPIAENILTRNLTITGALSTPINLTLGSSTATAVFNQTSVTFPNRPAFLAVSTATQTNVTGASTYVTVEFGNKIFDRATNYSTTTYAFTAPVTGLYFLSGSVNFTGLTANHDTGEVDILIGPGSTWHVVTSHFNSSIGTEAANAWSLLVPMTSGQTASVIAAVLGSSPSADITGASTDAPVTWFSGYLVG